MAKVNKSFADELRSAAYIWLGNTNIDNTQIFLTNFNKNTHWILVENNEDNITLKAPKETLALSHEIFAALYEIYPDWKKKNTGKVNTTALPKKIEVTSDCNETLFNKNIKFLPEGKVLRKLKDLGIGIDNYEYTEIKVDNSSNYKPELCTRNAKLDPAVLPYLFDINEYKTYKISDEEECFLRMLDEKCYVSLLLMGKAGCGKSTAPLVYCAHNNLNVIVSECVAGMDADFLTSNFVPNKSGGYDLIWGPLVYAFAYGTWFVLNEVNYADPGTVSTIHSMIDGMGHVRLHDGSIVKRHPDFRLILTGNPGYAGTLRLNEATKNRCAMYHYPEISKETLIERLEFQSGNHNRQLLEVVANSFDSIRGIYKTKNFTTDTTFRNAERFLHMLYVERENIKKNPKLIDLQFDMAFVYNAIDDMNDIEIEISDMQDVRKSFVEDIKNAFNNDSDVKEASWTCQPEPDLDDLTSQIADDGSFLDLEDEEA